MKIGVKYCGGCNPYYNRIKAAQFIKQSLPGHMFLPYVQGETYDAVLVVCGCTAACANAEEASVYLTSQDDIKKVLDRLKNELGISL